MRRIAIALLVGVVLVTSAAPALAGSERQERTVARVVNEMRHRAGHSWLRRSWPLDSLADRHALSMGQNFRLRPVDRVPDIVGVCRPDRLPALLRQWRWRVQGRWTRMGVGVERYYGWLWVVVVFR